MFKELFWLPIRALSTPSNNKSKGFYETCFTQTVIKIALKVFSGVPKPLRLLQIYTINEFFLSSFVAQLIVYIMRKANFVRKKISGDMSFGINRKIIIISELMGKRVWGLIDFSVDEYNQLETTNKKKFYNR